MTTRTLNVVVRSASGCRRIRLGIPNHSRDQRPWFTVAGVRLERRLLVMSQIWFHSTTPAPIPPGGGTSH